MNMMMPTLPEGTYHITDVDYFNPDETIITVLKRAVVNKQDIHLELTEIGELLLLAQRGEYFARLSDEQAFFTTDIADIDVSVLGKGDRRLPAESVSGRNIDELMWKAAFYNSNGRLMEGCYPADMVELDHWPNLSRLPHTTNTARIAALLSRHPATIAFVARLLHIAPTEAYLFYSAASAAGLAKPVNRTQDEPKLEPHRHQTLLSSLLKRISDL